MAGLSLSEPALAAEPEAPAKPRRSLLELALHGVAALCALVAVYQVVILAVTLALRLTYPYDLEWMEGGMLAHSLRIMHGHGLYGPPTVDFVPYLYTPLYPALVAALAWPLGLSYTLARAVSVGSLIAVCFLAYRICRREGSALGGVVAVGLIAAAFPFTGAWYDIARNDSLFLALSVGVLYLVRFHHRSWRACALAGVLVVAAFFTKQTASLIGVAAGAALLVLSWRGAMVYGASAGATLGVSVWIYNTATHGWFWTWIYKMHQKHDFNQERAYDYTPEQFWKNFPTSIKLALVVVVLGALFFLWEGVRWLAHRAGTRLPAPRLAQPTVGFVVWTFFGAVGFVISAIGFGTQFSWFNAFLPGTTLLAIAVGVAIAELGRHGGALLGGGARRVAVGRAAAIALAALLMGRELKDLAWSPEAYVPQDRDRAAGAAVLKLIRDAPGEVLIVSHPFYAFEAGKRVFLHRMGIRDVLAAGLGAPQGLAEGLRAHRWAMVLLDDKVEWDQLPDIHGNYKWVRNLAGADLMRTFTGSPTHPFRVYVPIDAKGPPTNPGAMPAWTQ